MKKAEFDNLRDRTLADFVTDWIADTAWRGPIEGAVFLKSVPDDARSYITYGDLRKLMKEAHRFV